jgi:hypothetical protein
MNRLKLLQSNSNKEESKNSRLIAIFNKDIRFLDKKINDLEYEIQESYDKLNERLSSECEIDASVVEVHYAQILSLKEKLETYSSFKTLISSK